jgi:hypothetical protein
LAAHAVASPRPDRYILRGPERIASAYPGEVDSGSPIEDMRQSRGRAEQVMRAEIEKLVDEIKQSVGLLRRHL